MNIFFNGIWGSLSTLLLIGTIAYIISSIIKRDCIVKWKVRILSLLALGLLLCICVVMRDDYVAGMQGSVSIFAMDSMPIYLCYLAAIIIGITLLLSLIIKNQKYLQLIFYTLSTAIIFKILIIEVSRIFLM